MPASLLAPRGRAAQHERGRARGGQGHREPTGGESVSTSIWAWGALYLAYALAAVGIWLAVERPWVRPSTREPGKTMAPSPSDSAG